MISSLVPNTQACLMDKHLRMDTCWDCVLHHLMVRVNCSWLPLHSQRTYLIKPPNIRVDIRKWIFKQEYWGVIQEPSWTQMEVVIVDCRFKCSSLHRGTWNFCLAEHMAVCSREVSVLRWGGIGERHVGYSISVSLLLLALKPRLGSLDSLSSLTAVWRDIC